MHRVKSRFAAAAVLWLLLAASSHAVEFAPPVAYAVGASPTSVVTGDFNGDGKLDLAVLNVDSNTISILIGNGDGTFQTAETVNSGVNTSSLTFLLSVQLLLGDFNGDGKLDLAVVAGSNANNTVPAQMVVLLGNGDGTFQAPKTTTLPVNSPQCCQSWYVAIGDFNGDDKADAIVGITDSFNNMAFEILIGNGDGTFQNGRLVSLSGKLTTTNSVAVADFNKDGKLDLAFCVAGGVEVLAGQGDGTFVDLGSTFPVAGGTVTTLRVADMNADGYPDLIVDTAASLGSGHLTMHDIGVLLNNGSGGFLSEQVFISNTSTLGDDDFSSAVVFGDFNGDGKLDVAIGSINIPSLRVLLGKGDGTFATPISFGAFGVLGVAGNFNGDKLSDLAVLNAANSTVNVLLNSSPASGTDLAILTSSASSSNSGNVGVGTPLTYTAHVMNEGPQDATGVTFIDTLPNSVSFVSASASQGTCSQASSVVTCSLGSLADTIDMQITIVVTPNALGTITNNMSITGNEPDGATANNTASQNSTVVPTYTLTMTKSGNGSGTVSVLQNGDCNSGCSFTFASGDFVDIVALPDAGSFIGSWGGPCVGNTADQGTNCLLTITSDTSASVTFALGDFTITAASTSLSASGGATVTDMIMVNTTTIASAFDLNCNVTGPAPVPTCALLPSSIANNLTSTLTITVPARNAILPRPAIPSPRALPLVALGLLTAFAVQLLMMLRNFKVPQRRAGWILGATTAASILILCSCGGSSSPPPPPPPPSYVVSVTATSGPISKTIQIQLTIH